MTEKQKRKLLNTINHKKLKRFQIENFCTDDCDINSLLEEKMIQMISEPTFEIGVYKPNPNDLFQIGNSGKDYLANVRKDFIRTYLPICISILSLIVSIISLMK